MKFSFILTLLLIALSFNIHAQDNPQPIKGQVTFVTSKSIYVKFENTAAIGIGDTLHLASTNAPCLRVDSKSSRSCVCTVISGCAPQKDDEVRFFASAAKPAEKTEPVIAEETPEPTQPIDYADSLRAWKREQNQERIRGSISVSEQSNIASARDDRHQLLSRLSVSAEHINYSKFSFETYLNYRQIIPSDTSNFAPDTRFFRVYNLALRFDANPELSFVLGRRINPKISSLGAIDGLQVEKSFGNTYVGLIAGSRPDILNYSFNSKLMEYGGYVGTTTSTKSLYSQTTLGVIEQRNAGATDRRYTYFQHASTIAQKLRLFSSMELDVFSRTDSSSQNQIRLTNLYVSAGYRFGRKVNLMVSYDSRKRIIYYETFRTEIERLLDDDLARQGIRASLNVRPAKHLIVGASYSNRFQSNEQNKSDNLHGFVTLSKLPWVGGGLSVTYNQNSSNYLASQIFSVRHSRSMLDDKLYANFYYRRVYYTYGKSENALLQNYYGTDLSYYLFRNLLFSVSGELSTFNNENNYRIYTKIVKRFHSKRK